MRNRVNPLISGSLLDSQKNVNRFRIEIHALDARKTELLKEIRAAEVTLDNLKTKQTAVSAYIELVMTEAVRVEQSRSPERLLELEQVLKPEKVLKKKDNIFKRFRNWKLKRLRERLRKWEEQEVQIRE